MFPDYLFLMTMVTLAMRELRYFRSKAGMLPQTHCDDEENWIVFINLLCAMLLALWSLSRGCVMNQFLLWLFNLHSFPSVCRMLCWCLFDFLPLKSPHPSQISPLFSWVILPITVDVNFDPAFRLYLTSSNSTTIVFISSG